MAALTAGLPASDFGQYYDFEGDPQAVPALVAALGSENPLDRRTIVAVLTQLLRWPPNRAAATAGLIDLLGRGGHGREAAGWLLWQVGCGAGG